MVDTIALLMMLISLLVGPTSVPELTVDIVDVKEGGLKTVVATRTKTGFTVRELKAGKLREAITFTKTPKKTNHYTVTFSPKDTPIALDATEAIGSLKKGKIPVGRHTIILRRSGNVSYLMNATTGKVWTTRPTPKPAKKTDK